MKNPPVPHIEEQRIMDAKQIVESAYVELGIVGLTFALTVMNDRYLQNCLMDKMEEILHA
jgi:hypothetical protein